MEPKQWVGIDVSGKRLEVFVRPIQRMLRVANSPAGLATLVSELLAIDPALIVLYPQHGKQPFGGRLTKGEIKYDKRDPDITEGKSDPVKFDYSAFHE